MKIKTKHIFAILGVVCFVLGPVNWMFTIAAAILFLIAIFEDTLCE